MIACVATHEGRFGTSAARLQVIKNEPLGLDIPQVCRHCPDAPCVAACPERALRQDPASGALLLDADLCQGCGDCASACPWGVLAVRAPDGGADDPLWGLPLVCDLCGGNPACARRCSTGALQYTQDGCQP